jgi:hypothetical protein
VVAGLKARCAVALLCLGLSSCASGDKVDSGFDTKVTSPAYATDGPRVLFDEAHHNGHTAQKSYRPFARLIASDGYRVERNRSTLTAEVLKPFAVLISANAQGDNERNDDPAFTEAECDAIRDWVEGGGSLLLITDHYPVGHANERLASRFGVSQSMGSVEDPVAYEKTFEPTHLVFSRENGGLADHPIVYGRNEAERIHRVMTFTGQAIHAEAPAVGFLKLLPTALARPPEPKVERRGRDVIVNVLYGDPVPVPGWSQGLALELGRGRVVVLGEAAMLTARFSGYDGRPIGMNTPGYDNRQLALNIMRWLSRAS